MANHMNVYMFIAMICSAGATSCEGGKCNVGDETSLMQYQNVVTPGKARVTQKDDESELDAEEDDLDNDDVELEALGAEKFTLAGPTMAPGCHDMGCYGTGPHCGGNSFDCTSQGLVVVGWVKSCSSGDTCESGWKVRCGKCHKSSGAKPVPMPAPSASPTLWNVPPPAPTPAPATTAAPAPAPVLPTNSPTYKMPKFDANATKKAEKIVKLAHGNVTLFKQALHNATKEEHAVHKNITIFEQKESHAKNEFHEAREHAVHYAKKVELANITVMRATKAMANAYYAEKGAAAAAQTELTKAKNAGAEKRYYEKVLVDKKHATHLAEEALHVGQMAVDKAMSDLALAKKHAEHHHRHQHHKDELAMSYAEHGQKLAMEKAVLDSKVNAYVEASVGRNDSNVPPLTYWGP